MEKTGGSGGKWPSEETGGSETDCTDCATIVP